MKESKFYKFSLVLPLAVPALMTPLLFVTVQLPKWLVILVVYTTFSGIIGGIPYLILVGLLFWWARGKSDPQFKRALIFLPIFMVPLVVLLFGLCLLVEAWLKPENALPVSGALLILGILVPFILGFGYFYLLLVFGTARVLTRQGVLVPSHAI